MGVFAPTFPVGTGVKVTTLVIQHNNNSIATYLLPNNTTTAGSPFGNMRVFNGISNFINDLVRGVWKSNTTVIQGGAFATIGATFASVVNTNTMVIGGVTITATNGASPTSVQFKVGSTDTATAANAATTINALTTLNKAVFASSSGAVLTITSLFPGTIGNLITTTATGGTITVAAALAGGTDGTIGFISHGL